jgi:hypothetical protein
MRSESQAVIKANTVISYLVRSLIVVQLTCFLIVSKITTLNMSSAQKLATAMKVSSVVIAVLLVLDWITRKDPSRRRSKLVDTVLGIAWVLLIGAMIVYSLSMGTL